MPCRLCVQDMLAHLAKTPELATVLNNCYGRGNRNSLVPTCPAKKRRTPQQPRILIFRKSIRFWPTIEPVAQQKTSKDRSDSWSLGVEETKLLIDRVRSAVRRCCPPYLASQAEDIAQEVLVQLVRKLGQGEGKLSFSSIYLMKAAHGVTVDEIRRRSRRQEITVSEGEMTGHRDNMLDPEREAFGRSLGREIRCCLDGIVPARRMALTLYLLGCSVPEIAHRLGCPVKSADNRVYRGMKNLRECLEARGVKP